MPAIRPKADVTFGILGRSRRLVESGEKQSMNREMLKQQITGTIVTWHGVDSLSQLADRILALLTPPATAKLPEGVEIVKADNGKGYCVYAGAATPRYGLWKNTWSFGIATIFDTEDAALTAALAAPPVPGEKPTPDADVQAVSAALELVREHTARIAELEAENARLRAQYDMVEQERTRLMLGQQVPYTPAEKPDPRLTAPNGRAMVEYRPSVSGTGISLLPDMFGYDGEQAWMWQGGKWVLMTLQQWNGVRDRQPCTFDGTPITETKPDPLARAVTVGEFNEKMQRLADIYVRAGMPTTAKFIRDAFTSTQGAAHAE